MAQSNTKLHAAAPAASDTKSAQDVHNAVSAFGSAVTVSDAALSKFDPRRYRQAQNVRMDESAVPTRKMQTVIPVRKPSKKQFIKTHASDEYRVDALPTIEDEA